VRAAKFRRLTFVHTTLHRLLAANDVLELFQAEDPFEQLWSALARTWPAPAQQPDCGRTAGRHRAPGARRGSLGISCVARYTTQERCCASQVEPWEFSQLAPADIARDLPGCLQPDRRRSCWHLGGSMLHLPPAAEG
jgi:hypothetical protein